MIMVFMLGIKTTQDSSFC